MRHLQGLMARALGLSRGIGPRILNARGLLTPVEPVVTPPTLVSGVVSNANGPIRVTFSYPINGTGQFYLSINGDQFGVEATGLSNIDGANAEIAPSGLSLETGQVLTLSYVDNPENQVVGLDGNAPLADFSDFPITNNVLTNASVLLSTSPPGTTADLGEPDLTDVSSSRGTIRVIIRSGGLYTGCRVTLRNVANDDDESLIALVLYDPSTFIQNYLVSGLGDNEARYFKIEYLDQTGEPIGEYTAESPSTWPAPPADPSPTPPTYTVFSTTFNGDRWHVNLSVGEYDTTWALRGVTDFTGGFPTTVLSIPNDYDPKFNTLEYDFFVNQFGHYIKLFSFQDPANAYYGDYLDMYGQSPYMGADVYVDSPLVAVPNVHNSFANAANAALYYSFVGIDPGYTAIYVTFVVEAAAPGTWSVTLPDEAIRSISLYDVVESLVDGPENGLDGVSLYISTPSTLTLTLRILTNGDEIGYGTIVPVFTPDP